VTPSAPNPDAYSGFFFWYTFPMSKVQEALKAMQNIEALKQGAIEELLEQRKTIDEQLSQLGFEQQPKSAKGKVTRQRDPEKPCGVCKFATDPPHDGRAHKSKQKAGKFTPFNADELKEYGYSKKRAASA
jgi:DNA repair exonuclease SbcCD ATPase subunit